MRSLSLFIIVMLSLSLVLWPGAALAQRGGPPENPKEMGTPEDLDRFLNELNSLTKKYFLDGMGFEDARREAFHQWAAEHHSDPLGHGPKHGRIRNRELPSTLGVVDMDWLATMGNLGLRGPLGAAAYLGGKEVWLRGRSKEQTPDRSTFFNTYPDTNWRAVAIADLLSSGKVAPEEIFRPGRESEQVKKKRASLDTLFLVGMNFGFKRGARDNFRSRNEWTGFDSNTQRMPNPASTRFEHAVRAATRRVLSPKPVGGIDLTGAGKIEGLDEIVGFRLDPQSSELALIGRSNRSLRLAPTHPDDIAVLFRAVYAGHSPTITIDPDPNDPEGPLMLVIPSEGIGASYVNWILYHSDRLMKSYSLGYESLTQEKIDSSIAGYAEMLKDVFDSGSGEKSVCERFWIVPSTLVAYRSWGEATALLEYPLQVQTRRCHITSEGRVQDLVGAESTRGAERFARWFTANLAEVGVETRLDPPPERQGSPVDIFAELRRIAGLTAVVEYLRNQGIPLPIWVGDHRVTPVPVHAKTPALTVTNTVRNAQYVRTTTVRGGADLSFELRPQQTIDDPRDTKALKPGKQRTALKNLVVAKEIEIAINRLSIHSGIAVNDVKVNGDSYRILRLGGLGAKDVGHSDFLVDDVSIPVGSLLLRITRRAVFGLDSGPWGKGWEIELPSLRVSRAAGIRVGNSRTMHRRHVLHLDDEVIRFGDLEDLPELGTNGYRPASPGRVRGLVRGKSPWLSGVTNQVHLENDEVLHFDDAQRFVGYERDGAIVIYEWGNDGNLVRVTGGLKGRLINVLELEYSGGLLRSLVAQSDPSASIEYQYDDAKRLRAALSGSQRLEYTYDAGRVSGVSVRDGDGQTRSASFRFDTQGQLVALSTVEGRRYDLRRSNEAGHLVLSFYEPVTSAAAIAVVYDRQMQPQRISFADGSELKLSADEGEPIIRNAR